jgi:hypothetical protein
MSEPVSEITFVGFDPDGEPVIQSLADGSIRIQFEFMPPSWAEDERNLGSFVDFDEQLSKAIGLPVIWDDREVFVVQTPKEDTVQRIKKFLETYPKTGKPRQKTNQERRELAE